MNNKKKLILRVIISVVVIFTIVFFTSIYFRYTPISKEESFTNSLTIAQVEEAPHISFDKQIDLKGYTFTISSISKISNNEYYIDIPYDEDLFTIINDNYALFFASDNIINKHFSNTFKNNQLYMLSDEELEQEIDFNQLVFIKSGKESKVEIVINIK